MVVKVGEKYKIGITEKGFWKDKVVIKEVVIERIEKEDYYTFIYGKYDGFIPLVMYPTEFEKALKLGGEYKPQIIQLNEMKL